MDTYESSTHPPHLLIILYSWSATMWAIRKSRSSLPQRKKYKRLQLTHPSHLWQHSKLPSGYLQTDLTHSHASKLSEALPNVNIGAATDMLWKRLLPISYRILRTTSVFLPGTITILYTCCAVLWWNDVRAVRKCVVNDEGSNFLSESLAALLVWSMGDEAHTKFYYKYNKCICVYYDSVYEMIMAAIMKALGGCSSCIVVASSHNVMYNNSLAYTGKIIPECLTGILSIG